MKYPYTSKKLIAILASSMIMGTATFTQAASNQTTSAQPISIQVNGEQLVFPDATPYIDPTTNRTMIPIRFVSEALGGAVQWEGTQRIIQISKGETLISFKVDDPRVRVSGKEIVMDAKPVIKNNRTYVPLRFVSEVLGSEVKWNGDTRTVAISNAKTEDPKSKDKTTQMAQDAEAEVMTFADALKLAEEHSIDLQKVELDQSLTKSKLHDARELEDFSVNDMILMSGQEPTPDVVANTKINKEISLKLAEDGLFILEKTTDQLKIKIKKDLEEAYLSYLASQEALKIAEKNESQAYKNYGIMKKKFELGVITHSELLQADTLYSQARLAVKKGQVDRSLAMKNLNQMINRSLDKQVELKDHTLLQEVDLSPYTVDQLIEKAKQQRPDYLAQLKKVETEKAKAEIYASVFLTKKAKEQKITYQKEELALQQMEKDMRLQLSSLLENIGLVSEQLKIAEKNVSNLKEVLRVTETKVQNGMGVELELLSAQIKLMEAEKSQIDAKYNLAKLYRTLFYSIGQDLTPTPSQENQAVKSS